MPKTKDKPIRFSALIRVSTEKQAAKGESLRTQESQIERTVESFGGKLVKKYAGQEHGTPGHERQQLEQLLADAAKKNRPFDAVIVCDASRWSRDNVASETGLDHLRDNGVRFFVLGMEFDLFDPMARWMLGQQAGTNKFQAMLQKQKSLLNRIERAKRGIPTTGKIPFGRVWNKETQQFEIDPDKHSAIKDIAERYLAGESLSRLALEYSMNHTNLCKVLRERSGDKWEMKFAAPDLNIDETVTLTIPPLLPKKTIRDVLKKLKANRTYIRSGGKQKNKYLLSGYIFCAECGYAMFGQENRNGNLYYRHAHTRRDRECPIIAPRPWVRADDIEQDVLSKFFDTIGNPAAIERAVKNATPDSDKLLKKRDKIRSELSKIEIARTRVLKKVTNDLITDDQADSTLKELKEREAIHREKLEHLDEQLANVPDSDMVEKWVEQIGEGIMVMDDEGNVYEGGNDLSTWLAMDDNDRRSIIEKAFAAPTPDGSPAGVYVSPVGNRKTRSKNYKYTLRGNAVVPYALHYIRASPP